ncbi:MAG: integrin alpha, partial [Planctomycetota bacterium]
AQVFSGASGDLLLSWTGAVDSRFGWSVGGCGDVDGDGVADVVVGAPSMFFLLAPPGVTVFSGATGAVLRNWVDPPGTGFGEAAAGVGDIDGDGTPDVAAGAPMVGMAAGGEARVYSGSTGALLRLIPGNGGAFGSALARAGDVDDDGVPDLVVGAPQSWAGGIGAGQARVYSGANGAILRSWNGTGVQAAFGSSVAGGGDVDGDGRPDLAVGAPGSGSVGSPGQASVFSGATGGAIFVRSGISIGEGLGISVAIDGDANGDGWADLAVGVPGAYGPGGTSGVVRIFAGPAGNLVDTLQAGPAEIHFGMSVAFAGRVDVGACDDLVIGAPSNGMSGNGMASIRSSGVGGPFGFTDLGNSLAGSGGLAPRLRGLGLLQVGTTVTLAVRQALGGTIGVLAVGASIANVPAFQGILVPYPDLVVTGLMVNGAGEASISTLIPPPPLPPGTTIYLQALFLDAGAPQSVSFSNALSVTAP